MLATARINQRRNPVHGKALFRLAKACEGGGKAKKAEQTLERLLTVEPKNKEAMSTRQRLDKSREVEKMMFGGMFDRVHLDGGEGALYSEEYLCAEAERMAEKEKESPFYEPPEPSLAESLQEMIEQKQAAEAEAKRVAAEAERLKVEHDTWTARLTPDERSVLMKMRESELAPVEYQRTFDAMRTMLIERTKARLTDEQKKRLGEALQSGRHAEADELFDTYCKQLSPQL